MESDEFAHEIAYGLIHTNSLRPASKHTYLLYAAVYSKQTYRSIRTAAPYDFGIRLRRMLQRLRTLV